MNVSHVLKRLSQFTSCDVSDALVKYGVSNGGYIPNLTLQSTNNNNNKTMVGTAYTVLFASRDDPEYLEVPELKGGYIDNIPENSVLVIGTTLNLQKLNAPYTKVNNALYGGLMSTRAQYLKSSGTVVIGRIRDLKEHQSLERMVFSYGVGSTAHGPVVKLIGINVPLQIKYDNYPEPYIETIKPGDFIIGDENGIVKLSCEDEELVTNCLEYMPKRVAADTLVAQDINNGKNCVQSQKLRREAL
ncbi:hypothetical protein CANARDRAFT_30218 [[Candida] arabinofermentans NRRL YB-2248]|uniref:4-hydroxy-4-methyl-2-oxoglutarate aldolase n=1 Tax=[Candida] arabinofermentans NRRL YB-2248 TaxID=983967 RepID=A0A1E4SUE5_9ASCO|nr:hypothetical protein CANARDRAFT_30218 [[Candida] arabinofermentans NRRL YB-2248]